MAPALPFVSDNFDSRVEAELFTKVQFVIFVCIGFTKYIAPPRPVAKLPVKFESFTVMFALSFIIKAAPTFAVRLVNAH